MERESKNQKATTLKPLIISMAFVTFLLIILTSGQEGITGFLFTLLTPFFIVAQMISLFAVYTVIRRNQSKEISGSKQIFISLFVTLFACIVATVVFWVVYS